MLKCIIHIFVIYTIMIRTLCPILSIPFIDSSILWLACLNISITFIVHSKYFEQMFHFYTSIFYSSGVTPIPYRFLNRNISLIPYSSIKLMLIYYLGRRFKINEHFGFADGSQGVILSWLGLQSLSLNKATCSLMTGSEIVVHKFQK